MKLEQNTYYKYVLSYYKIELPPHKIEKNLKNTV